MSMQYANCVRDQIEVSVNPSYAAWGYFRPKHNDTKMFENNLNHVMLVFIGKLSPSTLRWVLIAMVSVIFRRIILY